MTLRLVLGGIKSFLPLRSTSYTGTGGSTSGSYCYSVWMRHLSVIDRYVHPFHPQTVVEIRPGDSIGLGLAALLTGARRYCGLDVLQHASAETNVRVLGELIDLLRRRAPIPDDTVFPQLFPRLQDYSYPAALIDESAMDERLSDSSVTRLRVALGAGGAGGSEISYVCPWSAQSVPPHSADLLVTQVALQDMDHTVARDDLRENLRIMATWLKHGGVMCHQVDLSCPGGTPWNHHWAYGSLRWWLIRGRRPYYVNRVPLSEYLRVFEGLGLRILGVEPAVADGLRRERLAAPFRHLPDSDLRTRAALIVAVTVTR